MNESVIPLSPLDLAIAALLLAIPAVVSFALRLGLLKKIAVAGTRTVVQLTAIGFVLGWVFDLNRWLYVVPVLLVMLVAASRAAVQRAGVKFDGAYLASFASLVVATTVVTFSMTEIVIGVDPWYQPQYIIPLLGMLLGNGLTGISLAMGRMLDDFKSHRDALEARLALGAGLWEAALPWFSEAVRTGMVPILNSMSVVGLVSLPGMMTGQILAGAD